MDLVSEKGISPEDVKCVREWPKPTNVSEIRSFVGLCSYIGRFVAGFSTVCKPLYLLKDICHGFKWTEKCQVSFDSLKFCNASAPELAFLREAGSDPSNVASVLYSLKFRMERKE